MLIRDLRPEEAGVLKGFLYEAIFLPEGVEPPERSIVELPELRLYYEGFGTGRADICMVAEDNGRIVGAAWTRLMKDYGYVDDETPSFAISLYREYRGQGIGTKLMQAMLQQLRAHGFKRASLAVQKANYAVQMYEKVGFHTASENAEEYIMVCDLQEDMRPRVELESMTPASYERARRVPRDTQAETFVGSVEELIENAEYGRENDLIGNIFLIKADGRDVGYVMIGEAFPWPTDPPEMAGRDYYRLMYFLIDSQYRGRGIGGEAMERAIETTYRQFGARPIALGCHKDNADARRFYLRHGFRETEYMEGNDCYMLRDLPH